MEANTWIIAVAGLALSIAVLTDLSFHRIPNWLTFGTAITCVGLQSWFGQWNGLLLATTGLLIGLLCFLPSYLYGVMGAGDVKLMAAMGAALGPWPALLAVVVTLVAGGVIALVYIGLRGGMAAMVRRYGTMVRHLIHGQLMYLPPAAGEAATQRFPYAVAIACGTALAAWAMQGQGGLTG